MLLKEASTLPLTEEEITQTMESEMTEIVEADGEEEIYAEIEAIEENDLLEPVVEEPQMPILESQEDLPQDIPEEEENLIASETSQDAIAEEVTEKEEEKASLDDTAAQAKQYDYLFVSEQSAPEVPKDLDSSRNIAQWHSRDDIVRDKFEKHVQKIRYEIGILKQRSDILWYEKKLVEGITLLPNDIDFQKQLADLYFHQWKYKKAQSLLKKILADNVSDHNALWQVGEIAVAEWNNDDAYLYLQQAYAACDDNPKYCFSLAQWYYDHDALDQALPLMEKMVKLRPKNIDYLVSLSHVQHKMGMSDQAKQSLLRALELDPMNVTLKNYLKSF